MQPIALVTGAGTGIGREVAIALAKAEFSLVLAGRRSEPLMEVASNCGDSCIAIATDVAQPASIETLFAGIERRFGRLDLLFNNAGIVAPKVPFEDIALSDWQSSIDINLTGAFLCAQAAYRMMKRQSPPGGRIINNGSLSASVPRPRMTAYTSSKHAISGLTKSIALEGRSHGIACSQIDIGNAATKLSAPMIGGALQADSSIRPEPAFDAKHVADTIVHIAKMPLDVNALFITLMASAMPYVGRG